MTGLSEIVKLASPAGSIPAERCEIHVTIVTAADDETSDRQGPGRHRTEFDSAGMKPLRPLKITGRDKKGALHTPGSRPISQMGGKQAPETVRDEPCLPHPLQLVFECLQPLGQYRPGPQNLSHNGRGGMITCPMALPMALGGTVQAGKDQDGAHGDLLDAGGHAFRPRAYNFSICRLLCRKAGSE